MEEQTKQLQDAHASLLQQRKDAMKLYDDLVQELDRRDKAMFEAIDMIVDLQSTVGELEREKEMVRIIEADLRAASTTPQADGSAHAFRMSSTRILPSTEVPSLLGDQKTLERMSSFLSDRGERTANLRDMVLKNRSSYFNMRKVSEASADPSEANHIASPSLSVLSESSFMSVYGKNKTTPDQMPSPPEPRDPMAPSKRLYPNLRPTPSRESTNNHLGSNVLSRRPSATSRGGASLSTQKQSLITGIDLKSQLGYVSGRNSSDGDASQSTASRQGRTIDAPTLAMDQGHVQTRQERRESLRRVITTSPNAIDFAHARMLPPTPDTTTSSMLRRHQYSCDALPGGRRVASQDSFANATRTLSVTALSPQLSPRLAQGNFSHRAPVPVIGGHKDLTIPLLDIETPAQAGQLVGTLPPRPRSADETTISHHRANSWGSGSGSDGGASAHSEASDLDYWMHESNKPESHLEGDRGSPDLFSFPAESGKWETDAIFGAMRGVGFMGSPAPDLRRDPVDEVPVTMVAHEISIYRAPKPKAHDGGIDAPPPRRSSRSARTSSMTAASMPSQSGNPEKLSSRSSTTSRVLGRPRRNSTDTVVVRSSSLDAQADYQMDGAAVVKKSPYPPITGRPTRQRKSGALNRLFRRSIGSGHGVEDMPSSAAESRAEADTMQPGHARMRVNPAAGRSSVPPPTVISWRAPPSVVHDDLTSATPPPIMRIRAPASRSMLDGIDGSALTPRFVDGDEAGFGQRDSITESVSAGNTPQNGRRKWLGLGRRSSLMNRNAND